MSTYQVEPDELRTTASDLRSAATDARDADAADAVAALAGALPGSSTARVMPELATAWDEGIDGVGVSVATSPTGSSGRRRRRGRRPRAKAFQEWLRKFLGGGSWASPSAGSGPGVPPA